MDDLSFDFVPSQTDGRPMYQQIMERIRQHVAVGNWPAGTKLPSIRELAAAAKVSVITVKRAYRELEIEGLIVTRQGMGSWVDDQLDLARRHRQALAEHLDRAVALAVAAELPLAELQEMIAREYRSQGGQL